MKLLKTDQLPGLLPLFADRPTHHIARACCEGLLSCRAYADREELPTAAVLYLERFGIAFAAGDAAHAPALLEALRGGHPWYEVNDPPVAWHVPLSAWSRKSRATCRYLVQTPTGGFDRQRLAALAAPPPGCALRRYDAPLVAEALEAAWSEDQTGAYLDADAFLADGYGVALLKGGQLVAGCTSFCRYADGYEIQVDTHPDHRGHGYATCVSAAFMLDVLDRGLTPYWDAANATSLRLAEKLGFTFAYGYLSWMLLADEADAQAVAEKVIGPTGA